MRVIAVAVVSLGAVVALALPAAAQDKAKIDQGMTLFTSQKCALCHSVGPKGNKKGPLDEVGSKLKAEEIRQWIADPDDMRAKTKSTRTPPMKATKLVKEQIDALVAYLQTLKAGH